MKTADHPLPSGPHRRGAHGNRASCALARRAVPLATAISAILAGAAPFAVQAQSATDNGSDALAAVIVTATKVSENMQSIPISMEAIGTKKLQQLNIVNLDDYVAYLPGVTEVKSIGQGGNGIGATHVYMRGVVSGQDGNHSASQPSVATYLDEMPVTTIDGTVDLHLYDIARIEVLEGPQGTLYGSSSEAGTIRIITNKPDPSKFSASYDVGVTSIYHGGVGWEAEGYVNLPLSDTAAVRLVGWDEHDPGFISNVSGTNVNAGIVNGQRSFPTWTGATGQTLSNQAWANSDYNTVGTKGGRATMRFKLGDDWTVTPMVMGQSMGANGFFSYDPAVGYLKVAHSGPENTQDSFSLSTLTIEGKVHDFDITYAGGWFARNEHSIADYSDYSYFYDKHYGSGVLWVGNNGQPIMPQEFTINQGHFTKWSNELRVTTPRDLPVHGTVGVFAERQVHEIWQDYVIPGLNGNPYAYNTQGLAQSLSMPGLQNNTIWLTDEERVDRDQALFGQGTWDITKHWSTTDGVRFYRYNNSLQGFYGYSSAYQNWTQFNYGTPFYSGMNVCGPVGGTPSTSYAPFHFAPCTDLNAGTTGSGHTWRATLTYKFDSDHLVYVTYSTGYRPGGVNRVYDAAIHSIYPPYQPDTLTNYEFGWKTQWLGNSLRWNGAAYLEDWNNFQFSFLGPNSVTVVQNAASAQIKGIETDAEWNAGGGWFFSGSATFLDAKLTQNFCGSYIPGTLTLETNCPNQQNGPYADGTITYGPLAPSGTRLPVVPRLKANLVARYNFPFGKWNGYGQAAYLYQDASVPLLYPVYYTPGQNGQQHLSELPPYSIVNLSAGFSRDNLHIDFTISNALDTHAQLGTFATCTPVTCNQPYIMPMQPRTYEIKFGQKF